MRKYRLGLSIGAACAALAHAGVLHDEAVDGDITGDRLNPLAFPLALGSNIIRATSNAGDREYVALTVPAGRSLDAVRLTAYAGEDEVAFIAVQAGGVITEDPGAPDVANLLGWTHFGPGAGLGPVSDLLPELAVGSGAIGFTPPLASGVYSFWIQQTGPSLVSYELDFVTTPEPSAAILMLAAGGYLLRRRQHMPS
ncbi:MAG: PEP-CTERM sorting domain-containing protein [Phycisphaerales bacterium]|nr:PEP-CTERM sorting domain-containing protein [Phycisphaerales bacterium]